MKAKKVRCPYCGKRVALTKSGMLYPHEDKSLHERCIRSGGRPQ